ncbi:MAG: threonine synthase [candidate division Zixibacteria bacterium]|nr:threonine synthase [candidate division Zixibacteria bacterium]
MKYVLKCITCAREFESNPKASTCPDCGAFKGTLDVIYPIEDIRKDAGDELAFRRNVSVFRSFLPILPLADIFDLPPIIVGDTPIFQSPALSQLTGIENLWIKDDGRNPSASLKDRASAIAIAMATEAGASIIATASTGNAASSLATLAASVSMKAVLFVPRDIPQPKLAQLLIHGAHVLKLDCDYDSAFDLCQTACEKFGWYNRNSAVNPFTGEGKKTAALEIARDLGGAPDTVVCPVGDGCIIGGLYKGFSDLKELGLTDKMPRLYGIQAEGASPVVKAFQDNDEIKPTEAKTMADSISVGYPRDGVKALRAVKKSDGAMIAVSDDEIMEAQKILAAKGGIFAEPAASAAMAGMIRLLKKEDIEPQEKVVLLITGHGLKDIEAAFRNIQTDLEIIKPNIKSVENKIKQVLKTEL